MRLYVLGRYRSAAGSFEPGAAIDVAEEVGEFLLRDSPGSFRRDVAEGPPSSPPVATEETVSGLEAHDRRARGGQRRSS